MERSYNNYEVLWGIHVAQDIYGQIDPSLPDSFIPDLD